MLENWLEAPAEIQSKGAFGTQIIPYQADMKWPDTALLMVGLSRQSANLVRQYLYGLSSGAAKAKLIDMGNIRKENPDFIIPLLEELHRTKYPVLLLGGEQPLLKCQFLAYKSHKEHINVTSIDRSIDMSSEQSDLYEALSSDRIFMFSGIGYQSHMTERSDLEALSDRGFENMRLGLVRAQIEQSEPLLRDADMCSLNIQAIRAADMPAQTNPSPIGLTIEESCRLSRYSGMSDKLSSFSIHGLDENHPQAALTATGMAQIIWYFFDGFSHRKGDYPISTKGLTEYVVPGSMHQQAYTFWKSQQSGRWWLEIPAVTTNKQQALSHLLPCSYEDYLSVSKHEIPDRILAAISRFEKYSF